MKVLSTLLVLGLASLATANPEPNRACGTITPPRFRRMAAAMAAREATGSIVESAEGVQADAYFHVVAAGQSESDGNVPETKMQDQFRVLKETYARYGINFTLKGITRTINQDWATSARNQFQMKSALRKGGYDTLNVYFLKDLGGSAGICYHPHEEGKTPGSGIFIFDGCLVQSSTVPGGTHKNFNLGKATVHEVGHWMGLSHTFVGGSCYGEGDMVDDTPPQYFPSTGCPIGRDSCPGDGPDPIHNYMDATDDFCSTEFTPGQRARMHNMFNTYRK